jgi:mono/diheme cytochrome c family protein
VGDSPPPFVTSVAALHERVRAKMKLHRVIGAAAVLAALAAQPAASDDQPAKSTLDVDQLFATVCGFCHADGGRKAGKGPQLMDTARSDDFIRNRIMNGKEGAMPAFGKTFSGADIDKIVAYIRALKPE